MHRELDTSLAHRLRMAAGGGHNKAGGDVHIVDNETSNTFQFSDILIKVGLLAHKYLILIMTYLHFTT